MRILPKLGTIVASSALWSCAQTFNNPAINSQPSEEVSVRTEQTWMGCFLGSNAQKADQLITNATDANAAYSALGRYSLNYETYNYVFNEQNTKMQQDWNNFVASCNKLIPRNQNGTVNRWVVTIDTPTGDIANGSLTEVKMKKSQDIFRK